jgi:hypothetical protein
MLLLTDGTVMCKSFSGGADAYGNVWNKLTPDRSGSYVNGVWSVLAPMTDTRLYFSSQVLKDGRVFVAGGEYGTGASKGETYDPLTNTWTPAPAPGATITDANSQLLPDGRVLVSSNDRNWTQTIIFDPVANAWVAGPNAIGNQDESAWLKLPDGSILTVDIVSRNSERYIPSLNQWVADAHVPVDLYDPFGDETGASFLLPDGRAFFIGSPSNTAYYTPSGGNAPGNWVAGPPIPGGQGAPDAAAAMMVNGKILCALSPTPTAGDHFPTPTTFYEFDYTAGQFVAVLAPGGGASVAMSCYLTNMLMLPDGTVLYSQQYSTQYYVYTPGGAPLPAGKPTISSIKENADGSFHLIGTLLNGISQGAGYGDDWQMPTNYPIVRLTSGANVYYARTYNWSDTGVMTGAKQVTTEFMLSAGIPDGTYQVSVIANGIASNPVSLTLGYFMKRVLEVATTFANENDGTWLIADWDRDGIPDLVFIKTGNTPNGHVEVHVASGKSNYQTRVLEVATTFANENDGTWLMADWSRDGIPDLIFIKTSNTPNGHVEVHVASGKSNYQTRVLEVATTFANENDGTWLMADWDRDGIPDLIFIKTSNTPNGHVEVHVASGKSNYQTRVLEVATTFANENDGTWLMADWDHDGIPDLVFIKTSNTPNGHVEVHIASGKSNYQTRVLEVATTFANENDGTWLMADWSRDGVPDLIFIKTSNTPNGHVEVHIASGKYA